MLTVGLFIPCYVEQFYPQVGLATLRVLERHGVRVEYPEDQTCCGQPMANSGCGDEVGPLAEKFLLPQEGPADFRIGAEVRAPRDPQVEEDLGERLFDRSSKDARLTEAGRLLEEHAVRLMRLAEETEAAVRDLRDLRRGRVLIGANEAGVHALLPMPMRTALRRAACALRRRSTSVIDSPARTTYAGSCRHSGGNCGANHSGSASAS